MAVPASSPSKGWPTTLRIPSCPRTAGSTAAGRCEVVIGSVFSGAGLLDAGLAQAGHEHAWFVESDEWRRGHLSRRWPDAAVRDDVRTSGAGNLGAVDCI